MCLCVLCLSVGSVQQRQLGFNTLHSRLVGPRVPVIVIICPLFLCPWGMSSSVTETDLALLHTSVRAVTLTYGIRLWNTIHHLTLPHTHFCHVSLTRLTSLHLYTVLAQGLCIRPQPKLAFVKVQDLYKEKKGKVSE